MLSTGRVLHFHQWARSTEVEERVQGDGEIDVQGTINAHDHAYIECTMYERHEALDTLKARQGGSVD